MKIINLKPELKNKKSLETLYKDLDNIKYIYQLFLEEIRGIKRNHKNINDFIETIKVNFNFKKTVKF